VLEHLAPDAQPSVIADVEGRVGRLEGAALTVAPSLAAEVHVGTKRRLIEWRATRRCGRPGVQQCVRVLRFTDGPTGPHSARRSRLTALRAGYRRSPSRSPHRRTSPTTTGSSSEYVPSSGKQEGIARQLHEALPSRIGPASAPSAGRRELVWERSSHPGVRPPTELITAAADANADTTARD